VDIDVARRAYAEAKRLGASDKVMLALFETGYVESNFENLSYGDRDSVGFLQQRPSAGWGTREQCMNVEHATRSFVKRAGNVEDRHASAGTLAQAVQVSAFPLRYNQRRTDALALIGRVEREGSAGPSGVWPFMELAS
jgi:hypothetical protein